MRTVDNEGVRVERLGIAGLLLLVIVVVMLCATKRGGRPQLLTADGSNFESLLQGDFCVSLVTPTEYRGATMIAALRNKLTSEECGLVVNPLASSPEMDKWAEDATRGGINDLEKALLLFRKLVGRSGPNLASFATPPTAQQVFSSWDHPSVTLVCQDYTFLYVALARAVGIKAFCADVTVDWRGSNVLHSCAAVSTPHGVVMVDLASSAFGARHRELKLLNDLQVIAMFLATAHGAREREIARKLFPESPFVRFAVIEQYARQGNWSEAQAQLTAMEKSDPYRPSTIAARGLIALHRGDFPTAGELFEQAVALAPETGTYQRGLGFAYMNLARWREARTAFETSLRFAAYQDNAILIKSALAIIDGEESLAAGDATAALNSFDRAVQLTPDEFNAYLARARARLLKQDDTGALADFNKAVEFKPDAAQAYMGRGAAKLALGDLTGADSDLEEAIELDGRMYEPYYNRGLLRVKTGDLKGAKADFTKVLSLAPNSSSSLAPQFAKLGSLQNDRHEFGEALESFRCAQRAGLSGDTAAYVSFAIWTLRSRLGEQQLATAELEIFLDSQSSEKRAPWTSSLGDFLLRRIPEATLMQNAQGGDERQQRQHSCEAYYYRGMKELLAGNTNVASSCLKCASQRR